MKEQQIESNIYLFIGETYSSNSTAFINEDQVLLVDGMASLQDAKQLRKRIERDLKKEVSFIVVTHYFSDHLAALKLFPRAQIIAHQNYMLTFSNEKFRTAEEEANFVEPTMIISDGLVMKWGRYTLDIFHNPGHTPSTVSIDVPEANLIMAADNVVGNLSYISYSTLDLAWQALSRLKQRGREQLLSSHMGVRHSDAVDNAMLYLDNLKSAALAAWQLSAEGAAVLDIPLERCLRPDLEALPYEEMYHQRNLQSIVDRRLLKPCT